MQAWACLWVKTIEKRFKADLALRRTEHLVQPDEGSIRTAAKKLMKES
jgi:hypothetical protein